MRDAITNGELLPSGSEQMKSARETIPNAIILMHGASGKISFPTYNQKWRFKDPPFESIGFTVVFTALDVARALENVVPSVMPD